MIQLFGSFCGQPASATKPGTLAPAGTAYTPERSARRSRMPVAASVFALGFGACASPRTASMASSAPTIASGLRFIFYSSLRGRRTDVPPAGRNPIRRHGFLGGLKGQRAVAHHAMQCVLEFVFHSRVPGPEPWL